METNLPSVHSDSGDNWGAIPTAGVSLVRGRIIKFSTTGDFLTGEEDVTGEQFAVVGVEIFWVKWQGSKPVETLITTTGSMHPRREELGDLDPADWEDGLDGRPVDPWRDARNLYLIDAKTAEEFTFVTSSFGGRSAIASLARQIGTVRKYHARATPIIELASEKMKTRFGVKPKPLFRVIDWRGVEEKPANPSPAERLSQVIDDDIPFAPEFR